MNRIELIYLFVAAFLSVVATPFGLVGLAKCIKHRARFKMYLLQVIMIAIGILCMVYVYQNVKLL